MKIFINILFIISAAALWGSSGLYVVGITHNASITPVSLAFWRDLSGFLFLLVGLAVWKPVYLRVQKRDWLWLTLMGAIGFGAFHLLWNMSVLGNGVAVATLLQYNEAALIGIGSVFLFGEEMTWRKTIAIVCSLVGTAMIAGVFQDDALRVTTIGLVIGLGSAVTHAAYSLAGKKLVSGYHPLTVLLYAFGLGSLFLLPFQFAIPLPAEVAPRAVGSFAALVLGPTLLAFVMYTASLRVIPASNAIVLATLEVVFAAFFGWFFLGERLGWWGILGGAVVVAGVILVGWDAASGKIE